MADAFYPSPQAAICGICRKLAWTCPHDWSERISTVEWEAFARGLPWNPPAKTTAPFEATRASGMALEDSEKFPGTTVATPAIHTINEMRVRACLDDAPPAPRNRHYLCGCTILFSDPWIWKILRLPESHQQGCLYAENERFVASLQVPVVVEAPRVVIERPAAKVQTKRTVVSLALDLPEQSDGQVRA